MKETEEVCDTRPTLMSAYESLVDKKHQLNELKNASDSLSSKLNRTEGMTKTEVDGRLNQEKGDHKNIVELFESLAHDMQHQINMIAENIHSSMNMID